MATKTATMMQPSQFGFQVPTPPTYTHSRQNSGNNISPSSSNNSGNTNLTTPQISPTMNKSHLPNLPRQVHPPKSPLYRPAALRTTEWTSMAAKSNAMSARGDPNLDTVLEDEVGNSEECTGPPGRGHWKPDSEASVCDASHCNKTFTLFERRHHCRHCGKIFCSQHTPHMLPLDQNSRFNSRGYSSRVCDSCNKEYKKLCAIAKSSRTSSSSSGDPTQQPTSPIKGTMRPQTGGAMGGLKTRIGSYVGSVPRDWSWSTF